MEEKVNLKRFRQAMNLTQAKAAESIGIDQRQWNRYENGKNEMPVRYLKELCIKHKISADWLLEIKYENEGGETMNKQLVEEVIAEIISKIEAMRDNGDIEEEKANYLLIPMIEDVAKEAMEKQ